jgi:hypothetical protein
MVLMDWTICQVCLEQMRTEWTAVSERHEAERYHGSRDISALLGSWF